MSLNDHLLFIPVVVPSEFLRFDWVTSNIPRSLWLDLLCLIKTTGVANQQAERKTLAILPGKQSGNPGKHGLHSTTHNQPDGSQSRLQKGVLLLDVLLRYQNRLAKPLPVRFP